MSSPPRQPSVPIAPSPPQRPSAAIASSRPRRPRAASSTADSSSVVVLTAEDLLDTADSATVDSRTRWPEASGTKSTFMVNQPLHSKLYHIPEQYSLLNAKDWVACDVPPDGYKVICVYAAAFEAGMRLPFHDLHIAVLRHYDIASSQLMPNAWRYLNAFVLLCEDAGVRPVLPLFRSFFVISADKGESLGRFHFKPYRYPLSPLDSGTGSSGRRRRHRSCLFTGKMPPHPMWKGRFFYIRGPSLISWPCSMKWGTPSMASIKEPVLTNDTTEAIRKLVHLAGDTGIDIMKFLSRRYHLPVGHLHIPDVATPQLVAVKQEANDDAVTAAACTEQTRKRKSPEPITPLPPSSTAYDDQSTEPPPAPEGVGPGLGHGKPSNTGGDPSRFRKRLHHFAQEAMADFDDKEQELQMAKQALVTANTKHEADVAQLKQALEAANTKHAADVALLKDEVEQAKAEASRHAEELQKAVSRHVEELQKAASRHEEELQKAVQDAYNKGTRDTRNYVVESLVSASNPFPGPGLAPQAPMDDQ